MGQLDREVAERVRAFVRCHLQRHEAESRGARSVLVQLGALLDDAIARLSHSFETLSDLADEPAATERRAAMKACLDETTTALQFHDIAMQLVAQSARRIESLEALTARFALVAETPLETWSAPCDDVPTATLASREWTSVTQSAMSVGEVELF